MSQLEKPEKPVKPVKPPKPLKPSISQNYENPIKNKIERGSIFKVDLISENKNSILDSQVIKEGILSKMNREGKFDKCYFVVTNSELKYSKLPAFSTSRISTIDTNTLSDSYYSEKPEKLRELFESSQNIRIIPMDSLVVCLLDENEMLDSEKRSRIFKIYSLKKSFYLRAKDDHLKTEWIDILNKYSVEAQKVNGGRLINIADTSPIWSAPNELNCQICNKQFNFFVRKHHCRNCGKCICEQCSVHKVRIPRIDEKQLFKVCNPCSDDIKSKRTYGF